MLKSAKMQTPLLWTIHLSVSLLVNMMYTVLTNFFTVLTVHDFSEHDQNDPCHCCQPCDMPRLSLVVKARAIGQLQAGVHQSEVAQTFGVHRSTKSRWRTKFHETGYVKGRPRSGRNRVTTPAEDRYINHFAISTTDCGG